MPSAAPAWHAVSHRHSAQCDVRVGELAQPFSRVLADGVEAKASAFDAVGNDTNGSHLFLRMPCRRKRLRGLTGSRPKGRATSRRRRPRRERSAFPARWRLPARHREEAVWICRNRGGCRTVDHLSRTQLQTQSGNHGRAEKKRCYRASGVIGPREHVSDGSPAHFARGQWRRMKEPIAADSRPTPSAGDVPRTKIRRVGQRTPAARRSERTVESSNMRSTKTPPRKSFGMSARS